MKPPSTKQKVWSFLLMVSYLNSYKPYMSDLTSDLRDILKKDSLYQCAETHETEFHLLKKAISNNANL